MARQRGSDSFWNDEKMIIRYKQLENTFQPDLHQHWQPTMRRKFNKARVLGQESRGWNLLSELRVTFAGFIANLPMFWRQGTLVSMPGIGIWCLLTVMNTAQTLYTKFWISPWPVFMRKKGISYFHWYPFEKLTYPMIIGGWKMNFPFKHCLISGNIRSFSGGWLWH